MKERLQWYKMKQDKETVRQKPKIFSQPFHLKVIIDLIVKSNLMKKKYQNVEIDVFMACFRIQPLILITSYTKGQSILVHLETLHYFIGLVCSYIDEGFASINQTKNSQTSICH
jgi:hypothetical protein